MSVTYQEGNYTGEVTDQALSKTKNGVHQFVLRFKVLGMEPQQERNLYMFLTDSAMPYTKENLRKLGYKDATLSRLDLKHPSSHSFVGTSIEVYCKHEMYDGKMNEKWALSGAQDIHANPPTASELTSLDRMFSAAGTPVRDMKPAGAMVNNHGLEVTDDDIPF